MIASLALDIKHENAKILLISNPHFVLEEAFDMLAGNDINCLDKHDHFTPAGLFNIISQYGNQNLTLSDCEEYLYTFDAKITKKLFKTRIV